jgi:hypothetical protein
MPTMSDGSEDFEREKLKQSFLRLIRQAAEAAATDIHLIAKTSRG